MVMLVVGLVSFLALNNQQMKLQFAHPLLSITVRFTQNEQLIISLSRPIALQPNIAFILYLEADILHFSCLNVYTLLH